jgi:hypothetical protein
MLSKTLRMHTTNVLLAFVAAGFALLLIELILINHLFQLQLIAVGSSAIGLLLSLLAFLPRAGLRRIITGLYVVLALVGLFGFFIHATARSGHRQQAAAVQPPSDRTLRRALTSFTRNPPIVPPLALSGLATLGIVVLASAGVEAPAPQVRRQGLAASD